MKNDKSVNRWLMPANHNLYNHEQAFEDLKCIDWKTNANYNIGDLVYVYATAPYSRIEYLVKVIDINISSKDAINDRKYWVNSNDYDNRNPNQKYTRMEAVRRFDDPLVTMDDLKAHGLKGSIQRPRKLTDDNGNYYDWASYILSATDIKNKLNEIEDLQLELSLSSSIKEKDTFKYTDDVKKKNNPVIREGIKVYIRDRKVALNALSHANYCCEYDTSHKCFMKKDKITPYTEAHHLIPMEFQDDFSYSLDVEENIVSLCGNCHNEIHYGEHADILITKLYNERKGLLDKKKIGITLEKLLSYYGF